MMGKEYGRVERGTKEGELCLGIAGREEMGDEYINQNTITQIKITQLRITNTTRS